MSIWNFHTARRFALLSALLTSTWSCTARSAPERAVIQYVELVRAGQCNEAFRQLSPRLRDALQVEVHAREEERHLLFNPPAPIETLYCSAGLFERVKLRRTRTAMVGDSVADVRLVEAQPAGHLVPGFWFTRIEYVDIPMRAVTENGEWRVESLGTLQALDRSQRARRARANALRRSRRR
jgi:hypothetical protein